MPSVPLGQRLKQAGVDPHRELRGVRGRGEGVEDLARALAAGVGEVKGLPVEPGPVGDVVHGVGHEVDRDEVGVAELGPDERKPSRQVVPEHLDRREEVIGPVDLVHLAGLGVADDDRRAVDAPRHLSLGARDLLGLELRSVVGVLELLALVEHVLTKQSLVSAGDRDRGRVVERPRPQRVGQLHSVAGALDVGDPVAVVVDGHVVDRREMEEVADAGVGEPGEVLVGDAQARLGEVPDHGVDSVLGSRGPLLVQRGQLVERALADEDVDVVVAFEQPRHQVAADETGRPRDEIGHVATSRRASPRWPHGPSRRPHERACACPASTG